jgi:hypothetical protein
VKWALRSGETRDERSTGDMLREIADLQRLAEQEEEVGSDEEVQRQDEEQSAAHLRRAFIQEELVALESEALNRFEEEAAATARVRARRRAISAGIVRLIRLGLAVVAILTAATLGLALSGLLAVDPSTVGPLSAAIRAVQGWVVSVADLWR